MKATAAGLDRINIAIAAGVRWIVLLMVLMQFCLVLGRYVFGVNSIAAQESVLYMHAAFFMLGAGYTMLVDGHVRVDVVYSKLSKAAQRRVDIFGHLFFLMPAMLALLYWSWPSVHNSWKILEGPLAVGGIEAVFLLKSLIPAFCVLVMLQSLSILIRLIAVREA